MARHSLTSGKRRLCGCHGRHNAKQAQHTGPTAQGVARAGWLLNTAVALQHDHRHMTATAAAHARGKHTPHTARAAPESPYRHSTWHQIYRGHVCLCTHLCVWTLGIAPNQTTLFLSLLLSPCLQEGLRIATALQAAQRSVRWLRALRCQPTPVAIAQGSPTPWPPRLFNAGPTHLNPVNMYNLPQHKTPAAGAPPAPCQPILNIMQFVPHIGCDTSATHTVAIAVARSSKRGGRAASSACCGPPHCGSAAIRRTAKSIHHTHVHPELPPSADRVHWPDPRTRDILSEAARSAGPFTHNHPCRILIRRPRR